MKRTFVLFGLGLALTFALAGCNREQMPDVTPTPAAGNNVTSSGGSGTNSGSLPGGTGTPAPDETDLPIGTTDPGVTRSAGSAGMTVRPGTGNGVDSDINTRGITGNTTGTTRSMTENTRGTTGTDMGNMVRDTAHGIGDAARNVTEGIGNATREIGNDLDSMR